MTTSGPTSHPGLPSLRWTRRCLTALTCFLASHVLAHECWIMPEDFAIAPGESAVLRLEVGMNLEGQARTFTPERVARLRHHSALGTIDLTGRATSTETWPVPLLRAGSHVLAFDSQPSLITLEADKFNSYLADEGLDGVLAARAAAGTSSTPGRERYQRCNKTLVQVGDAVDDGWNVSTEQRLEIRLEQNPGTLTPLDALGLRLTFDGEPVAGALVRAWHRTADGELTVLPARTDADGFAAFNLAAPGMWMLSTVHMIPVADDAEADWESYWGNFTFVLR